MAACMTAAGAHILPEGTALLQQKALSNSKCQVNSPRILLRGYGGEPLRLHTCQLARCSKSRFTICAMDASLGGEGAGPAPVFSRIGVRDPYKRLGLSRDASTEEIQEAKSYLLEEYAEHEKSREAIESAYDKIIAEKFIQRKRTKMNLKADLKKRVAESPPWVQNILGMAEVPAAPIILQRLALFGIIAAWSILSPSEGGPAFQVAVALAASVYLLNDRLKSLGRAATLGFLGLVVGWVVGSIVVPFIPSAILPRFWSLELGTALVSFFFLWGVTTFLK